MLSALLAHGGTKPLPTSSLLFLRVYVLSFFLPFAANRVATYTPGTGTQARSRCTARGTGWPAWSTESGERKPLPGPLNRSAAAAVAAAESASPFSAPRPPASRPRAAAQRDEGGCSPRVGRGRGGRRKAGDRRFGGNQRRRACLWCGVRTK